MQVEIFLAKNASLEFFNIFSISILQNYMVRRNFTELYICRRGPRRQGHNVVAYGGRSHQQWARSVRRT
jgi:hypothetical protein